MDITPPTHGSYPFSLSPDGVQNPSSEDTDGATDGATDEDTDYTPDSKGRGRPITSDLSGPKKPHICSVCKKPHTGAQSYCKECFRNYQRSMYHLKKYGMLPADSLFKVRFEGSNSLVPKDKPDALPTRKAWEKNRLIPIDMVPESNCALCGSRVTATTRFFYKGQTFCGVDGALLQRFESLAPHQRHEVFAFIDAVYVDSATSAFTETQFMQMLDHYERASFWQSPEEMAAFFTEAFNEQAYPAFIAWKEAREASSVSSKPKGRIPTAAEFGMTEEELKLLTEAPPPSIPSQRKPGRHPFDED